MAESQAGGRPEDRTGSHPGSGFEAPPPSDAVDGSATTTGRASGNATADSTGERTEERPNGGRVSFARTLLLGVAASVLAAISCAKPWALLRTDVVHLPVGDPSMSSAGQVPLALAVCLAALAAWGAILVTRGVVRRALAILGLVLAVALVVIVAAEFDAASTAVRRAVSTRLALPEHLIAGDAAARTGWYWTAAVAALAQAVAFAAALRQVDRWPVMGARYDAPATAAAVARDRPRTEQEMWKALDQGVDPTEQPSATRASGEGEESS